MPPHASALGKVLLAFMNPVEASQILGPGPLKRFTKSTETDPAKVLIELEEVRRTGIAYETEEVSYEVSCAASPIKDPYGAVIAAVSITVPAHRMAKRRDDLSRSLRSAAADITRRLAQAQSEGHVPLDDPSRWRGES